MPKSPTHVFPNPALDRRTVAAGLAAFAASLTIPLPAFAGDSIGKVGAAEGRSTGLLAGIIRELAAGSEIFLQEIVQTDKGARLSIVFGPETSLKLGERTRVKIEKSLAERGGELTLARGAMLFERPAGERGDMVVKTPFAVIAARGTGFWAGPSKDVPFGVFVQHGLVNVRNRAGSVDLTKGLGTDLSSPDVAPTAPKAWGEARIAAALKTID
jgi:ferric-dicitrate binding protein FerR (iron transport regulator)